MPVDPPIRREVYLGRYLYYYNTYVDTKCMRLQSWLIFRSLVKGYSDELSNCTIVKRKKFML